MKAARFFRATYDDNRARASRLRRRLGSDLALYAANRALEPLGRLLARRWRNERWPVAFIVGPPRSGTTLLYQLLARYLEVAYPSNFMARFWMAPTVGAWLDRRRRGGRRRTIALESDYGRTRGPSSPHEFGWFWRHRMPVEGCDALSDEELATVDADRLRDELTAMAGIFGRPLVWKNINFTDYHVVWLHGLLPDARFIRIERDPVAVALSILGARRRHYGDPMRWWSLRPRDVDAWRDAPWAEQIAHQIRDADGALSAQTAALPAAAVARLTYEELVRDPRRSIAGLAEFLGAGIRDPAALERLELEPGGDRRPDPEEVGALERALAAEGGGGR